MRNGISSKLIAIAIAATVSVGIAACDANVTGGQAGGAQMPPGHRPPIQRYAARPQVLRAELDAARGRVWTLHADGVELYDATTDEKLGSISLPGWTWASEPYACLPALAVGPRGDVLVTSNVIPVIWHIDAASFEVTRHDLAVEEPRGKDVGFSGLAYSTYRGVFFAVSGLDGSLWWIDPSFTRALPVALSAPTPQACGESVIARAAQLIGPDALCVRTELGDRTVDRTSGYRSGNAHAAQC